VKQSSSASIYIALLRGINVGGKQMLPMAALSKMFTDADCADVRTYIQSGNVVFSASPKCAKEIPQLIAAQIKKSFGFEPPIIVRIAAELQSIIADNPFLKSRTNRADEDHLHLAFLSDGPSKANLAALDPNRSPGDSFAFRTPGNREIYLHLPNGVARTKLSNAWFDSKLNTISTMRNWRTILKLSEMTSKA
jgi:uncharacterized protein (DUF1697 family)